MWSIKSSDIGDSNDTVASINERTTRGNKAFLARVISSGADYQV